MERMRRRKTERRQTFPPRAVWLVINRPAALIFYDIALGVEFFLGHRRQETPHAIRFKPERQLELLRWDSFEVVGSIEPGRTIQRPAGSLNELEVFIGSDICRALEEHVLEEMRKAGSAFAFIRGADVVPEVYGDNGRGPIGREREQQTVLEPRRLDRQ